MCRICNESYPDFTLEHTEQFCPFRNSRYCSYCASYGHLTKSCPAKPLRKYREPCYVEQTIPSCEIKDKNARTPIKFYGEEESPRILSIQDNDMIIYNFLQKMSIKIPKGFTMKQVLEEYAKQTNQRIVYELN